MAAISSNSVLWQGHDVRRAQAVAAIALTVGLLGVGCSSGDEASNGGGAPSGGDRAAMCAAYDRYAEASLALAAPEVFELSTDEVSDVLADRRRAGEDIEVAATDEVAPLVRRLPDVDQILDERVLDAWDHDRARLRAKGDRWLFEATGPEVADADGVRYRTADLVRRAATLRELLYATCEAPELLAGPPQDRDAPPPSGVIS